MRPALRPWLGPSWRPWIILGVIGAVALAFADLGLGWFLDYIDFDPLA